MILGTNVKTATRRLFSKINPYVGYEISIDDKKVIANVIYCKSTEDNIIENVKNESYDIDIEKGDVIFEESFNSFEDLFEILDEKVNLVIMHYDKKESFKLYLDKCGFDSVSEDEKDN